MNNQLSEDTIKLLIERAESGCIEDNNDDDFCIVDYAGSNVDDAYVYGRDTGAVQIARFILDSLGIKYKVPQD